jgi:DNA-binding response OmpR family regulator
LIFARDAFARTSLSRELAELGLEIRGISCLLEAKAAMDAGAYGLVVVDVTDTKGGGFEVLRAARSSRSDPVVIMLLAPNDVQGRVDGLEHGADASLSLPLHGDELRARARALLRRRALDVRAHRPPRLAW